MESVWFLDTLVDIHLDAAATGGEYAVVTCTAPAGHMPPPHVHADEDEAFVVLDGELTIHQEAGATVLRAGDALHAPRGLPHTLEVTGADPCRWLIVSRPGDFADFVRAFGTPAERRELPVLDAPPDVERLADVAGEHGITFVGPPGTRPAELVAGAAR